MTLTVLTNSTVQMSESRRLVREAPERYFRATRIMDLVGRLYRKCHFSRTFLPPITASSSGSRTGRICRICYATAFTAGTLLW